MFMNMTYEAKEPKMSIKDKICCAWWALTGTLGAKVDAYIRIYTLVTAIREGLYKLRHLGAGETPDFGVMHNLGLLCSYITTGSYRCRNDAPDTVLLSADGRKRVYEELVDSVECMSYKYWKARVIILELAGLIIGMSVSSYSVPAALSQPDCDAFDK